MIRLAAAADLAALAALRVVALANDPSHRFDGGAGFEETERVVRFRKPL